MSYKQQIQIAEQLIDKIKIPTLPKEIIELQKLFESTDIPDHKQVKKLISANPFIAGELVSLANILALNGSMQPKVNDLNSALFRLGNQFLKNYIMAIVAKQFLDSNNIAGLSRHSQVIGQICTIIAHYREDIRPDEAYLLGLLHDIGTFVLTELDSKYGQVFIGSLTLHYALEHKEVEKYGTSHSAIGYVIARSWFISKSIAQAILLHHAEQFSDLKSPKLKAFIAVIELAHALEIKEFNSAYDNAENQKVYDSSKQELALSEEQIDEIRAQMSRYIN